MKNSAAEAVKEFRDAIDHAGTKMGLTRIVFAIALITLAFLGLWNWVWLVLAFYAAISLGDGLYAIAMAGFSFTMSYTLANRRDRD